MIYTEQTIHAMRVAYQAHHGQTDRSGAPYFHHVLHIAEGMPDERTTVAALLHDTLEDTSLTADTLLSMGFSSEVVEAVRRLTHDKSVPYLDYIRALRDNPIAVTVKLADLAHNSDVSRLPHPTARDIERIQIYRSAQEILRTTEVVAALIWQDERFMICQRPAHKARGLLWEFAGGKIKPQETPQQALVRECQEELGVTVSVDDVFMDVTHLYPDLTVHLTLFYTHIVSGTPQLLEHHDLQWITPADIDRYDFCPADVVILEKIKRIEKLRFEK